MKSNLRKLLIGLVVVIVLAVIFLRGDQLIELADVIKTASIIPLVLAVCTQLGKYFAQSYAYHFAFEAVHEEMKPKDTLPLVFGTFFMNTLAPSLNLAGTSLVIDDARRRGIPPGKSASAALLMQVTIDSGFAIITLLGFTVLMIIWGISPAWYLLSLLIVCIVSVMVLVMVVGSKKPELLIKILSFFERLVNRILAKFKKNPLDPWAETTAYSFSQAGSLIWHSPGSTVKAFLCSVCASLCELSAFCLVGIGFGVSNPQALVCGYVVATLFAMVSITPQGVGVVEAAVLVAFTTFGETAAAGMAIGLVYRSIVFWMPFLIGAVLINVTKTFKGENDTVKEEPPKPMSSEIRAVIEQGDPAVIIQIPQILRRNLEAENAYAVHFAELENQKLFHDPDAQKPFIPVMVIPERELIGEAAHSQAKAQFQQSSHSSDESLKNSNE